MDGEESPGCDVALYGASKGEQRLDPIECQSIHEGDLVLRGSGCHSERMFPAGGIGTGFSGLQRNRSTRIEKGRKVFNNLNPEWQMTGSKRIQVKRCTIAEDVIEMFLARSKMYLAEVAGNIR